MPISVCPMRYYVGYNEQDLVQLLHKLGVRIEQNYNYGSWTVECDDYTWELANKKYRQNQKMYLVNSLMFQQAPFNPTVVEIGYGYGEQGVLSHRCLKDKCSESQKDLYEGVLDYHRLSHPNEKVYECGNVMCLIEQYKKI